MGKFSKYNSIVQPKERPWKIHPVWQGIGCLMIVLIPIMSFAGAVLLVDANLEHRWLPVPRELVSPGGNPLLYMQIGVTVLISMFGFMLFVIAYSLLYRFMGPPRYGPMDVPPDNRARRRTKARRR
ncbi:MAG: hypothetical protein MUO62_13615 [Anaerolineales bacterium]|nr:hypothetical protein [Anaerolineales bacterium]